MNEQPTDPQPNTWRIHWRNIANGRTGTGSKSFTREEAEKLVVELNEDYPEIEHKAINEQS